MYCRTYLIPLTEDWYDHYEDELYDLCVLDEFKGHKTIQFLNLWCQGSACMVKRKGITAYTKRRHIPTIIVSNFCIEVCYKKALEDNSDCLDSLKRRLEIIRLEEPININWNEEERN